MSDLVQKPEMLLSSAQILTLITRLILRINGELGKVSVETAYLAITIAKECNRQNNTYLKEITQLGLFHLFGALHFLGEKEIKEGSVSKEDINHFYLYGYHYLKVMTPLEEKAKSLLFYNSTYSPEAASKIPHLENASLIFFCQAIQKVIQTQKGNYSENIFNSPDFLRFNPKYIQIFQNLDSDRSITQKLLYETYLPELEEVYKELEFSPQDTEILFKLMFYIIDFKSTQTLQHTMHASGLAAAIGIMLGQTPNDVSHLFIAGILHDFGKVSIPNSILESPSRLSSLEYRVMQLHVEETEAILKDVVPKKIFYTAIRHHEKNDGSGYPNHLTYKELSEQDRIMTVADILSALSDRRSYKEEFSAEAIAKIFQKMADENKVSQFVPDFILQYYESISRKRDAYCNFLSAPLGKVELEYQLELENELEEM